ncbi:acyl-CoA dehydrogenase family protein [Clavibacter zhangzhiyongii]|uniref:Dibenzothiophene monooxygenase n=1 Tax=Clavibacter zhangzhiyongii TaxID=2768071 RepID=A0A7L7YZN5_9MICO|nr:acyl-CoA dehydrogenase family protein [Clavibacter zhangzhiyongii]QOD42916.1 acyl-CoA dehydrogenase family protein [Clavibacter zhangzhiyongii]
MADAATAATAATTAELRAELRPLFDRIREGAVARERDRELAHDAVALLREARFGAIRLPVADGGRGASLAQLVELIIELSAADANVGHLLRGHFGYVELVLRRPPGPARDEWIRRIASGAVVGNATSEQTGTTLADISTTLTERDGRWLLDGTKYYSTGTLYSDWIYLAAGRQAADGVERVTLAIPTDAPGVTAVDDWDAFGQTLTASGTTTFEAVEVDPATVTAYREAPLSHIQAFYQLHLVAVLAGIAEEVERDAAAYVRSRTRTYIHANAALPKDDPQVLEVVGRISSAAFAARATALAAAALLDDAVATAPPGSPLDRPALDAAENAVYQAQVLAVEQVPAAATLLFEVGGASATFRERALDRHWRNARVVASHNPAIFKARTVGEYAVEGRGPVDAWAAYEKVGATTFPR